MDDKTFLQAINQICLSDREVEAIQLLLQSVSKKKDNLKHKVADTTASLRAIRKLNAAHGKDEAIDALTEDI